ncbi:hypothetical protein IAT38_006294 [Cryptococcus sp. DSM 104549]
MDDYFIPSYITESLPPSAIPIPPPPPTSTCNAAPAASAPKPCASFPPTSGTKPSTKAAAGGSSTLGMSLPSISTNVSDLLLSSLLPPNLPKLPSGGKGAGAGGLGAPRELTSQREGLSLPLMSNNFRRFVTRVGPLFWLQDRVEEVLFWRKPMWTWAWMLTWVFISFQPRVLLLLPSLALIILLLHINERTTPLPSLLGIMAPVPTATSRVDADARRASGQSSTSPERSSAFTASTTKGEDGETVGVPVVPPKEAESGVDYYMNIQAIQNLMGLVSDAYDNLAPRLASLQSPSASPSPLSLPITHTHLLLLLLPPTLFLPLIPPHLIPYLLLPLGITPPLIFHPHLTPSILALPSHPYLRQARALAERWLMTDRLSDEIGGKRLGYVSVWENERLDPKLAAAALPSSTTQPAPVIPPTGWGAKFLRQSDRPPWVKVAEEGGKWKSTEDTPQAGTGTGAEEGNNGDVEAKVLALKPGWEWVPGEDWRVDGNGLWSEVGVDEEGWVYSDDSWQNPAPTPYTGAESPNASTSGSSSKDVMPGLALRRVTRRRRWWKRVYDVAS